MDLDIVPKLTQNSSPQEVQQFVNSFCEFYNNLVPQLNKGHMHSIISDYVFSEFKILKKNKFAGTKNGETIDLYEFMGPLSLFDVSMEIMQLTNGEQQTTKWISGVLLSDNNPFTRSFLAIRDGGYCVYCGADLSTHQYIEIDHLIPQADFSLASLERNRERNLVSSCRRCNSVKKNLSPTYTEEFSGILLDNRPFESTRAQTERSYWIDAVRLYISAHRHEFSTELSKNCASIRQMRLPLRERAQAQAKKGRTGHLAVLTHGNLRVATKHWGKVHGNLDKMTDRCLAVLQVLRANQNSVQLGSTETAIRATVRVALQGVADYLTSLST